MQLDEALAAACALHNDAIAEHLGANPTQCGTLPGGRVQPVLTCAVFTGDFDMLAPDQEIFPVLVEYPMPESGWRSQTDLRNAQGQRLSIELVSPVLSGGGNWTADAERRAATTSGLNAHRTAALRSIGDADRRIAVAERDERPCRVLAADDLVDAGGHVGLPSLSATLDRIELGCLEDIPSNAALRVRRIHLFSAPVPKGRFEMVVRLESGSTELFRTVSVRSHLRCRSSGAVIAVCESLYRAQRLAKKVRA